MIHPADFIQLFRDEADLREKVAALFRKIPRTQGVQITHGSQELGKDIVFFSEDPIGDWQLTACVVKNAPINGRADSNKGARASFVQAEQALDSPLISEDGSDQYPSHVFIISPYDCPPATMTSIKGKLLQRRNQISFLCGHKLAELFEKHLPEVLLFDSSFLGTYVLQLQKKLKQIDPIRFLMKHHDLISGGLQSFDAMYVRQDFRKKLCRFEIASAVVKPPPFPADSILTSELNEVVRWLRRNIEIVSDPQVWNSGDPGDAEELAKFLKKAAAALAEEGASGLAAEVRPSPARRRDPASRPTLIRVRLSSGVRSLVMESMQAVQALLSGFTLNLEAANEFTERPSRSLLDLSSPEFRNLCRVEEVIAAHPSFFRATAEHPTWNLPRDILDKTDSPLLITASAGYGKTSFCKWRVLEDIRRLEHKESSLVPFYVPLHLHATSLAESCEETFLEDERLAQLLIQLNEEGRKMRIFLDGLDEVSTIDQQRRLMIQAETLHEKYKNLQVVVTARRHVRGPWLRWLSRIELAEFDQSQSNELIGKWLESESSECAAFYAQLEKARTLEPLTRVPLLCTLIIAVFKRSNALPATRSSLYKVFVELMCGGWDLAKNVRRKLRFGLTQKMNVLTRLAGTLQANRKREASEHEFKVAVGEVELGSAESWRSMLDETLEDSLISRAGENIVFSHLSFQEYLAAVDLADPGGIRQLQALQSYLRGSDWWAEVLFFYLSDSPRPDEMADWVTSEIRRNSGLAPDYKRRNQFLMDAIRSGAYGWVPRNHQSSLTFGSSVGE